MEHHSKKIEIAQMDGPHWAETTKRARPDSRS
jgi:hypothetical protein